MSTNGAVGFVLDGKEYVAYNHSDSYPNWLGDKVVKEIHELVHRAGVSAIRDKVRALTLVDEDATPTEDQAKALATTRNEGVSTGDNFYSYLREAQGSLVSYLHLGFMPDNADFLNDSLLCEYAYIVNLDTNNLDYYRGFQRDGNGGYGRVKLAMSYPLAELNENTVKNMIFLDEDPEGIEN
jgi:hypothetical protein